MEPASAIVISIALGAAACAGKAGIEAVVEDAYKALKRLITGRYPEVDIDELEKEPTSRSRQGTIEKALNTAGASDDKELVAAAQKLAALIQQHVPEAAAAIGVDLKDVEAVNLRLTDIVASGTGARIAHGKFKGDIEISGVRAGMSGDASRRDSKEPDLNAPAAAGAIQIQGTTVGGNLTISDVTIQIYKTEQEKLRRITWRKLERARFPALNDTPGARRLFYRNILLALTETFGEEFKSFIVLFSVKRDEEGLWYEFICHQARFINLVDRHAWKRYRDLFAIKSLEGAERIAASKLYDDREIAEHAAWAEWSLVTKIDFSDFSALEITYDPQNRTLTLETATDLSLDPADYHQHLATTSELLKYLASADSAEIGFLGDIGWAVNNFRLMKLLMRLLDRREIEFDKIRVDANDCETWDFLNPEFEAEVLPYRKSP